MFKLYLLEGAPHSRRIFKLPRGSNVTLQPRLPLSAFVSGNHNSYTTKYISKFATLAL